MNTNQKTQHIFIGRPGGTTVFDPIGDPVDKVYDVVVSLHRRAPLAVGPVVGVTWTHRVFISIAQAASVKPDAVITAGLMNLRHFQVCPLETYVTSELLDHEVSFAGGSRWGQVMSIVAE